MRLTCTDAARNPLGSQREGKDSSLKSGGKMRYFKPWTTLFVGMALGYYVVPKALAKVGK